VRSFPSQDSNFTLKISTDEVCQIKLEQQGQSREMENQYQMSMQQASTAMFTHVFHHSDRPKILAVDDDPTNLNVLNNILSPAHYDITFVNNVAEALVLLDSQEWSLIITDAEMSQRAGYELTQQIRLKFSLSELPILLLAAQSKPEDMYAGHLAGANDYLIKPINSLELKTRVHALINVQRSINDRLRLEAAWLQAQIQPHFLFNTLNTIASLSEVDINRMIALLEEFGNYLQASFHDVNLQRVVPLQHELQLLRSYLYIEQERFGERLKVIWQIPENLRIELPPLSIQPLVENAIKHGILVRAGGGSITINIKEFPQLVEIKIIDDGVGMTEEKVKNLLQGDNKLEQGIGLLNTDRRLKQLYGYGLKIQSALDHGTTISFIIPKN
jgi:sensor histidine kinase YesM